MKRSGEKASDVSDDLRQQAERRLAQRAGGAKARPPADEPERLARELHLHQIEREIQNEEIERGRAELEATRAHFALLHDRVTALLALPSMAERLDERAFMQEALRLAEELTDSPISFLHFVHDDQENLELVAWSKRTLGQYCTAAYDAHYPIARAGIWADAFRSKAPVVFNDYEGAPNKRGLPDGHAALRRVASVPVLEGGLVRMLVGVGNKASDYTSTDVATLRLLSEEIWRIVQRRRDGVALRASEARHRLLFEANPLPTFVYDTESWRVLAANDAAVATYGYERHEFLDLTVDAIRPPESATRASERAHGDGSEAAARSESWRHEKKDGTIIDVEVASHAIVFAGRPAVTVVVTDVTEKRRAERERSDSAEKFRALVEQSLVGVFMLDARGVSYLNPRAEEIFGVAMTQVEGGPFEALVAEEDRERVALALARLLGGDVAVVPIEFLVRHDRRRNLRVGAQATRAWVGGAAVVVGVMQDVTDKVAAEQRAEQYVHDLERAMSGTVSAVSRMMDLRDPYTAGHERRVGELAAAIAVELGLDEHRVRGVRVAGGVHDVGKITVPAEILSKPSRLSPAEYEIIKAHAEQGYEVLKGIEFPWPVAEIVRQHHERSDGSGYPRGLRGEEGLLEARILAVADVVESMASHRPYRPSLGIAKALEEIEANAGRLYDAAAAAACLRIFREQAYVIAS